MRQDPIKQKFLNEIADKIGLAEYSEVLARRRRVFLMRFDPINQSYSNTDLCSRLGDIDKDKQFFTDDLKEINEKIVQTHPTELPPIKKTLKKGRIANDQQPWKIIFRGLWDDIFPEWLKTQPDLFNLLNFLDYSQQSEFEWAVCRQNPASAFLVQADDPLIRNWLVKRLIHRVPNPLNNLENAIGLTKPIYLGFEDRSNGQHQRKYQQSLDILFWPTLAKKVGISASQSIPSDQLIRDIVNKITEAMNTDNESIVIVIHDIHVLKPEELKAILEFWMCLRNNLCNTSKSLSLSNKFKFGIRLVLLMTSFNLRKSDENAAILSCLQQLQLSSLTFLDCLENITRQHVEDWLLIPEIQKKLVQEIGGHQYQKFGQKIQSWSVDGFPAKHMMLEIFEAINIKHGLELFDQYCKPETA